MLLAPLHLRRDIITHLFLSEPTFCRCEVGTDNWSQCNDHPIKICKYPVAGLFEGHSYYFRVRAVNSHGISKPSRMSDAIAALDPSEFGSLHGGSRASRDRFCPSCVGKRPLTGNWAFSLLSVAKKLGGKLEVVSFDEALEGECVGGGTWWWRPQRP